ncbi:MAG: hypothetical protein GDA44_05525 [Prochloron sp. SP5CPC1]|nr:hypothetical protein [Candidatus Paraprochloron terpiosi SP5CPC1]
MPTNLKAIALYIEMSYNNQLGSKTCSADLYNPITARHLFNPGQVLEG